MRQWTGVVVVALVGLAACGADGEPRATETTASPATTTATTVCIDTPAERTTVRYTDTEGVAANLQSLDVYPAAGCGPHPVLVWVHGGGWRVGDKANRPVARKAAWAADHGWSLVAVNYRLSAPDNTVRWPDHGDDVAAALAWIVEDGPAHALDPDRIALMGHSAGGHLVSIVSTRPEVLGTVGLDTDVVDCVVALDSASYDLVDRDSPIVELAFGPEEDVRAAASPLRAVADHDGPVADFLVVTRGAQPRQDQARAFVDAVAGTGADADVLVAEGYSHADVNDAVGAPDEGIVTPAAESFLVSCVA